MSDTPAWAALQAHYETMSTAQMRELFDKDPERFKKFSTSFNDILLDYSKNMCGALPACFAAPTPPLVVTRRAIAYAHCRALAGVAH